MDNLCITRVSCGALKQPTDPPEDEAKKRARDVSRALFCRQRALAGSNLTCHRFSLRDDGGEDDASYDRLYDDPWDAFSCGVNRAREPPKTFCRIKKTILFLGKQLNFERQKPKMPAPELWRVAQSGAGGKDLETDLNILLLFVVEVCGCTGHTGVRGNCEGRIAHCGASTWPKSSVGRS